MEISNGKPNDLFPFKVPLSYVYSERIGGDLGDVECDISWQIAQYLYT